MIDELLKTSKALLDVDETCPLNVFFRQIVRGIPESRGRGWSRDIPAHPGSDESIYIHLKLVFAIVFV